MSGESWLSRVDRLLFGSPDRLPRHLARAIIQEYDTSNRTGDYKLGPMRGTLHTGRPFYRREYSFELPIRYSPHRHDLLNDRYATLREEEKPVMELRDYMMDSMRGQIIGAVVGKYFMSVSLTKQADRLWQQTMPTDFYDHMFDFYRSMHPPVQSCVLRRFDGEYVSNRNISGSPEGPASAN